jgi:hypothetical protein
MLAVDKPDCPTQDACVLCPIQHPALNLVRDRDMSSWNECSYFFFKLTCLCVYITCRVLDLRGAVCRSFVSFLLVKRILLSLALKKAPIKNCFHRVCLAWVWPWFDAQYHEQKQMQTKTTYLVRIICFNLILTNLTFLLLPLWSC